MLPRVQCHPPWHTNGEAELQESKGSPVAVIFLEVLEAWLQLFCHGQGILDEPTDTSTGSQIG